MLRRKFILRSEKNFNEVIRTILFFGLSLQRHLYGFITLEQWDKHVINYSIRGGTYTITQTVNGCTSAPSGVAAPISVPAIPVVSVQNNCANSIFEEMFFDR